MFPCVLCLSSFLDFVFTSTSGGTCHHSFSFSVSTQTAARDNKHKDIIDYKKCLNMSQSEWFTTYLQYENLKDMLNVILYTSQSFMATTLLYYVTYHDKELLFIHTGIVGGIVAHYHIPNEKPNRKFIELNKMTGEFSFVDGVGTNPQSIYIPIVRLIKSTLRFPIDAISTV
jgi:hypothetical protein